MTERELTPEIFTTGYTGTPGHRAFYIQAKTDTDTLTYSLEKAQVSVLAEKLGELLLDDRSRGHDQRRSTCPRSRARDGPHRTGVAGRSHRPRVRRGRGLGLVVHRTVHGRRRGGRGERNRRRSVLAPSRSGAGRSSFTPWRSWPKADRSVNCADCRWIRRDIRVRPRTVIIPPLDRARAPRAGRHRDPRPAAVLLELRLPGRGRAR